MSDREGRTDLRTVEEHASWREVYYACGAPINQHEVREVSEDE